MYSFVDEKKQEFIKLANSRERHSLTQLAMFCYYTQTLTSYEIIYYSRKQGVSDILFALRPTLHVTTREMLMEYAVSNCKPELLLFAMNVSPMYVTPSFHRTLIYLAAMHGHHCIINLLNKHRYLALTPSLTTYAINVACKYSRRNVLRVLDLQYTDVHSVIEHINANESISTITYLLDNNVGIPHNKISRELTAELLNRGYKIKGHQAKLIREARDKKCSLARGIINNHTLSFANYDINITNIITEYITYN